MTTEQAPGIPWHDHEWVEASVIGEDQRYFVCMSQEVPLCPAEKTEPYPEPVKHCAACGLKTTRHINSAASTLRTDMPGPKDDPYSALTDPMIGPHVPLPGWHGPADLDGLLSMLRRSPGLGITDQDRLAAFLKLPAASDLPLSLRRDARKYLQV